MHTADEQLTAITDEIRQFIGEREGIASIKNEKDLLATSNIHQMNKQSRSSQDSPTAQPKKIELDHETAEQYSEGDSEKGVGLSKDEPQ